jgi:outer membrane lipoprotein-sorting protein
MKRWIVGIWLVAAGVLPAVAAPSGEAVLKAMLETYRQMQTFEEKAVENLKFSRGGKDQSMEVTHRFFYRAPNQFYYDIIVGGQVRQRSASDGKTLLTHVIGPRGAMYLRAEMPEKLAGRAGLLGKAGAGTQFDPLAFLTGNDPLSAGMKAEVLKEDQFAGAATYLVELTDTEGQKYLLWIGRDNHLLYHLSYQQTGTMEGQAFTQESKETHSEFKVNQPVDEKWFTIPLPANAQVQQVVYLIGQPAPEIKLKDMDGAEVDVAQYKGKTVVLNFWAHW